MIHDHLFSIITVVYNGEHLIEKTIKSVIGQTLTSVEYIIIDGESTDGTLHVINKYKDKITYIESSEDSGVYDAMNKALFHVKGEWVLFMNAGDIFFSLKTLENVANSIGFDTSLNLVYGDVVLGDKNGKVVQAKDFNYIKFGMPFCHQSVFVRSNIFLKNNFNNYYKICADYDFFLRLYCEGIINYKKLSFPIAVFDVNGISYRHNVFNEYLKVVKIQYGFSAITWYHFLRSGYSNLRVSVKNKLLLLYKFLC